MTESYAYIPLEEVTRNKLKLLKRELTYDQFINKLVSERK
jgi:hypothetical protein